VKRKNLFFAYLLCALAVQVCAQGTMLLRQPTVNSNKIVFVYANDLWSVDITGGTAARLTSNIGAESEPHFSPDGSLIAFTGQYDGNTDVYTIPAGGGEPTRLTWHPVADKVTGWTPDGSSIIFATVRDGVVPTLESRLYKINKNGGHPEPLTIPRAVKGEISENGQYIAYQQIDFWDPEWRNYRGGQAKPIWIVDLKSLDLKQTVQTDNERHVDPVWLDNVVYFLSERDFVNNVWSFDPKSGAMKQITFHKDFDVKSLDAGGGKIVYEQGGYLHLWTPSSNKSEKLRIEVKADFNYSREKWIDVPATGLVNATLSPTGKRALFEHRGEIISIPKENGAARVLTNSSSSAERSPVWSPDGASIAYFSDASGEYELVISDQNGGNIRKIAIPKPTFFFKPVWSPDGSHVAYTDTDYQIRLTNIKTGITVVADSDAYAHPDRTLNPLWSPDSKWLTYVKIGDNNYKKVKVYNISEGKSYDITDGMADAITPVWDATGKYIYFLASTNYALNTGWLDMSSYDRPTTRAIYGVALSKDSSSPFLPKSDEEKLESSTESKADTSSKATQKTEKSGDKSKVAEVKIDFDKIEDRIFALDIPEKNFTELYDSPDGYLFYEESKEDQEGSTIHRYNLKDRKSEVFLNGVFSFVVSHDRKSILYRAGGNWGILGSSDSNKKSGDGKLEALSGLKLKINPQQEWKQILKEGWRYQRDFLYVDNVHGAPWNDVYKWYAPWVDHVRHRSDLNYIVDIIGGEVAVGHSYTSGGDLPQATAIGIGQLGADYEIINGMYSVKKIYNGESYNPQSKAPLRGPGIKVRVGDYILAVNGRPLTANDNIYQYFENTVDKNTQLTVNDKPSMAGSWQVNVLPIGSENTLRVNHWIEGNRKKVDSLSKGQLAYVYVPNTRRGGYNSFNRYYFAQQDKKGAIIDERNNGGGSAADYMVDIMDRELQGYFNSRTKEKKPFLTPNAGIYGPKVMIINEIAGSGGDLLPYMFNKMKIGTLVGTKTWGGLVGTWDTPPFIDGGRMVAPRGGFYDTDGKWAVEGVGISPDVLVEQTPKDVIAGRDPQLEKAVEIALKKIPTEFIPVKPEPKAPIRYKRP
jgi:tricorn protease